MRPSNNNCPQIRSFLHRAYFFNTSKNLHPMAQSVALDYLLSIAQSTLDMSPVHLSFSPCIFRMC